MVDCAQFYRGLGFFKEYESLNDDKLADKPEEIRRTEWNWNLDPNETMDPMVLASWDKSRVWWEDAEWMGEDPSHMYTEILNGWNGISRGGFRPTDIVETWGDPEDPEAPVTLDVTLNGVRHRVSPKNLDDWIDGDVLIAVNRLIAPTGIQLEAVDTRDQTLYLVALTAEEKLVLQRRGWRFPTIGPPTAPSRSDTPAPQ